MDLFERDQLARLAIAAFEDLAHKVSGRSRRARYPMEGLTTHRGICSLAQLLQLLERGSMSLAVHGYSGMRACDGRWWGIRCAIEAARHDEAGNGRRPNGR